MRLPVLYRISGRVRYVFFKLQNVGRIDSVVLVSIMGPLKTAGAGELEEEILLLGLNKQCDGFNIKRKELL